MSWGSSTQQGETGAYCGTIGAEQNSAPSLRLTDPGRPTFDYTERGEASMADLNRSAATALAGGS